jgi:hypothetical protein
MGVDPESRESQRESRRRKTKKQEQEGRIQISKN